MLKEPQVLTVKQWLASVPAERSDAINAVRDALTEHLPRGYDETIGRAFGPLSHAPFLDLHDRVLGLTPLRPEVTRVFR